MYTALREAGPPAQPVALGLHRSDYMVDDSQEDKKAKEPRLLQVELNTIASSFGCLAAGTAGLHRFLLERYFASAAEADDEEGRDGALAFLGSYLKAHPGIAAAGPGSDPAAAAQCLAALPANPTLEALPAAIAAAHAHYGGNKRGAAVVVFVVQPGERNLFDQRFLELALWEQHKVPVVRLTLEQVRCGARCWWMRMDCIASGCVNCTAGPQRPPPPTPRGQTNQPTTSQIRARCSLQPASSALLLDGRRAVSVVYFRAGYTPADFPTEREWEARLLVERSAAVKCPTLGYQLAGTKKVGWVGRRLCLLPLGWVSVCWRSLTHTVGTLTALWTNITGAAAPLRPCPPLALPLLRGVRRRQPALHGHVQPREGRFGELILNKHLDI